jgi:Subtilase family
MERELIVIVQPETELRATTEGVRSVAGVDVSSLTDVLASENATLQPLFGLSEERLRQQALSSASVTGVEVPDLSIYYRVQAPDDRLDDLAARLQELDVVTSAYVKPAAELPLRLNDMMPLTTDAPPVTPDFTSRQGYLEAAPGGIDAVYAAGIAGGGGAGVGIIDIEGAWRFTHEDLIQNQGGVVGGTQTTDIGWRNHGTAVVGEFGGDRNTLGVTGICPDANVRAVSIFGGTGSAGAIRQAADLLNAGDIILIELHRAGPRSTGIGQQGYIAIEWWPDDFDAILYATSRGVIVVEAAGNGAENLDDAIYNVRPAGFPATWTNPFNRANRDSGAIVVGAGAPPPGTHGRDHGPDRSRLGFSNYGSILDAQGWGREVTTCGYGDLQGGADENFWYTDTFSGTSSASPIVVGALGSVQGVLRAQGKTLLSPATARNLLRTTGSPQQDAPGRPSSQRIGNRPNLREMLYRVASIWFYNKKVLYTYAHYTSQWAWAYIEDYGWARIKDGAADGVTNLFVMMNKAKAKDLLVNVHIEAGLITTAYLL